MTAARVEMCDSRGLKGWKATIPGGRPIATPAVGSGKVFFGAGYGSHEFHALDAATGKPVWSYVTDDDGPTAAAYADGYVVFNTESCTVYVLDAESGDLVWKLWLGDPLLSHPAVAGGVVYAAYPKWPKHALGAFDLRTGKKLWSAKLGHDVITAPVVHGGAVYASTYDGVVHAFAAQSGKKQWSAKLRATCAPRIAGGQVLVSRRDDDRGEPVEYLEVCRGDSGEGVRPHGRKRADYLRSKRASAEARELDSLDAAVGFSTAPDAAKLDEVEALVGEYRVAGGWRYQGSRPECANGRCFSIVGDELTCLDIGTGDTIWELSKARSSGPKRELHPPALANDRLFFATASGYLVCVDQEQGREVWSLEAGHAMEWSPAVMNGRVYAGTKDGHVLAVETGNSNDHGWAMWGGSAAHNG